MHANTRGRQRLVTFALRADHPDTPHRRAGGRATPALVAALVVGVITAACANDAPIATDELSPTFARATGSSLVFESPMARVGGMLPPTGDGEPWMIVGSVFDPGKGTAVATTWTSDDGARWTRADIPPADHEVSEAMSAVATTGDGLIAVGSVGEGAASDAAIWRHADGDWVPIATDSLGGRHEQWAFAVASGKGGTLVAGGENAWGEVRPRLWWSTDGETWESVDGGASGPFDATGSETLRDITAYGEGFVAVGSRKVDNDQDGIAWYSSDGRSWEEIATDELGGPGRQALFSVAATGGQVVAGGYKVDGAGNGQPVVWRSADGRSWSDASAPLPLHDDARTNAGDLTVRAISADDGTLIASGGSDWRPHVWRSTDKGGSWERLPNPVHGELFKDGVALTDAAAHGSTVMALGLEPTVLRLSGGRWQDATGHTDDEAAVRPGPGASCLSADSADSAGGTAEGDGDGPTDDGASDGGATDDGASDDGPSDDGPSDDGPSDDGPSDDGPSDDGAGASELPDGGVQPFATSVARRGDTTIVAGGLYTAPRGATRECYVGQVWRRNGDGSWKPIDSTAFEHGHIVDVATYEGGFVAVGFEDFGVAARRKVIGADVSPDAIIWTSPDGEEWKRVAARQATVDTADLELIPDATEGMAGAIVGLEAEQAPMTEAPAGGDGTHSLAAVTAIGNGFAAAGVRFDGRDVKPIMLTSGDAKTLHSQDTGLGGEGAQQFRDVCVGPGNVIVAVGDSGRDADFDVAVRRRNTDKEWSGGKATDKSFSGPGRQHGHGCAAGDDGFIVVGSDDSSGDTDARIWFSSDGVEWTRLSDGSLGGSGDQWASAAAAVPGGGWLVAGTDTAAGDGDIALWRITPDGGVHRRDREEPALGGPGEQTVTNLLVDNERVIIVGEDHGRVGLWESDTLDR